MKYSDVDHWEDLTLGTELDNPAVRAPDHRTFFAEWSYVTLMPTVAKISLLSFQNTPVIQRLQVSEQDGRPWLSSTGFQGKVSLVEHGVVNIERSGAIGMASIILAIAFGQDEPSVQAALGAHGLELKRVQE